jgi:two-component system, NarL family, nitrate/nitrite response regulator NarL
MMAEQIRVTLVDDHPLLRRGLRETLKEQGDFKIVGEGASADQAVELATRVASDIMILDVNMPGDGISAVSRVNAIPNPPRILVLSVFDSLANVRSAMANGSYGYILKGVEGDELAKILRGIHAGKKHVGPELAAKLLAQDDDYSEQSPPLHQREATQLPKLTKREQQILSLIGKGFSNLDIAKKLKLSEETVKHYNTPLFRKLGVRNRTEAALLGKSGGLSR